MKELVKISSESEFQEWLAQRLASEQERLCEEAVAREFPKAAEFASHKENYIEGDTGP